MTKWHFMYIKQELISKVGRFKLQYSTRIVLIKLLELSDNDYQVTIGYEALGKLSNVSARTCIRAVKHLVNNDYLAKIDNGYRNSYVINAARLAHIGRAAA